MNIDCKNDTITCDCGHTLQIKEANFTIVLIVTLTILIVTNARKPIQYHWDSMIISLVKYQNLFFRQKMITTKCLMNFPTSFLDKIKFR